MDKQTELLKQLAAKLGTTVEYLWSVLLRQAPVSATISLIQMFLIALFGYVLFRIHIRLSDDSKDNGYQENDAYIVLMCVCFFSFLIMVCASMCTIDNIINGYFNPEYWALEHVFNAVK
jgi:hypothetical protein